MKIFTAAMLMILVYNAAPAQTKLGLKLSPSMVNFRVSNPADTSGIENIPSTLALPIMATADFPIGKNYFFSSGVGYISRRMMFEENGESTVDLRMQYLQIPLTLKLFTDEVALDKRLYFQFGPVVEFKLHDRIVHGFLPAGYAPAGGSLTILLAAGMEVLVSPNTAVAVGLSYSRGLSNIFENDDVNKDTSGIRSDLLGIDMVVKF